MNVSNSVQDRVLERQGKRMIGPAIRFIAIASVPGTVGFGLLSGGAVARWAARHKLFA